MVIHNPILTGSFTVNNIDVSSITSSAANITALNATTASLNSFSASVLSYTASQNILNGTYTLTSSFAAQTASFTAFTASILAQTASLNSFSASVLTFTGSAATRLGALESYTSSLNAKTASFATTGSNIFIGTQTITGSVLQSGSFTTTGTIIAQTINVQTVTSSIVYSCGSNIFGTAIGNTQVFTGSMFITGSNALFNVGCVGIGTNNPTKRLHISGSGANAGITFDVDTVNTIIRGSSTSNFDLNNEGSGGCIRLYGSAIQFRTNVADPAVVINNGGCMGINCTAPTGMLTVGGDNNQIHVRGGYYASIYGYSGTQQVFGLYGSCDATYLNARGASGLYLGGQTSCNHIYLDTNGITCFFNTVCAPLFKGGTISGTSITGTSMTVATDCSGVIVDVAGRHGLMKYYNYGTGLIGCCTGTDGGISIWLGRFAGSITAPTGVYQDLKIFNNGIAAFACQVCAPSGVKFGSGASTLNYYEQGTFSPAFGGSTSGCGVPSGTNSALGYYTKIGNQVFLTVAINSSTFTTYSGNLIMWLPFASCNQGGLASVTYHGPPIYFYPLANWGSTYCINDITPYILGGDNYLGFNIYGLGTDRQNAVTSANTNLSGQAGIYTRFSINYTAV